MAEIMAIQQEISGELTQQKVGKTIEVVIDREEPDYYIGRTQFDSPEVDCEVLIDKQKTLQVGDFYPIMIVRAEEFDFYGTLGKEEDLC